MIKKYILHAYLTAVTDSIFRKTIGVIVLLAFFSVNSGCFQETSFPMRDRDLVRIHMDRPPTNQRTARSWLHQAHNQLSHLLPSKARLTLLTEDMVNPDGTPRDVFRHFVKPKESLNYLMLNYYAMEQTAQVVGPGIGVDRIPPAWPGFEQIWIPVDDDLELSGRIGLAKKDGKPIKANCIVILPGMWGDNSIKRTRDLALALLDSGFHVLALELRGHGRTETRYPDAYYTFGIQETQDLMKVSEWLEDHPYINRIGLVAFCWGTNHAMLAAWYDGRKSDDPSISDRIRRILGPVSPRRHFTAGIIGFSPVLRWEDFMDCADTPRFVTQDPAIYFYQGTLRERSERKGYLDHDGNLRRLINQEFAHSCLTSSINVYEAYDFLRFLPYRGLDDGDKMEFARTPVLIVHAANDPLLPAQDIADLIAQTSNPNVAAIILPGGGHIGFPAYDRTYYFSLIINYFDPQNGIAAYINNASENSL